MVCRMRAGGALTVLLATLSLSKTALGAVAPPAVPQDMAYSAPAPFPAANRIPVPFSEATGSAPLQKTGAASSDSTEGFSEALSTGRSLQQVPQGITIGPAWFYDLYYNSACLQAEVYQNALANMYM